MKTFLMTCFVDETAFIWEIEFLDATALSKITMLHDKQTFLSHCDNAGPNRHATPLTKQ